MAGSVEESGFDFLWFDTLWKNDLVSFFAFDIRIQVQDLDSDIEIVQQCHNLDLIRLLIDLLDLALTEELNRYSVLDESLVEYRIVFQFSGSQKSHHENEVVGDVGIAEELNDIVDLGEFGVIQLLDE